MQKRFRKSLIVATSAVSLALGISGFLTAIAATTVDLGLADNFAVIAGSAVNDSNPSVIVGNVGLSPTTGAAIAIPAVEVTGTIYAVDAFGPTGSVNSPSIVNGAKSSLVIAYDNAASQSPLSTVAAELGGTTKTAGIYNSSDGYFGITGTLTLDGGGDPSAVFIFKTNSTLTTASASHVNLIGGAQACNVFWQIGSSASLGTGSDFKGNLLALTSITDDGGSTVLGRLFARNGAVTLNNTRVTKTTCDSTLHIIKQVVNTGGGTAVASGFNVHVKLAGSDVSGSPAVGVVSPGTSYTLSAGTYAISEDINALYAPTYGGDCDASGNITLLASTDKTCTLTNTYIPPGPATLRVEKLVVNSSGGTAVASGFNVHVKLAGSEVSGSPAVGVASPGTSYSLSSGTYVVSEDANSSYVQLFSGDCNSSGVISLLPDDDKVCTIINTDIPIPTQPSVQASNSVNYFAPLPLINVTKVPEPLALPGGPGSVTYTYTVTNVGEVPMSGIWAKDDKCDVVNFISGDTNGDFLLDIGESWIYRCTKVVSQTEMNTVTVHGQANGWDGYDTANATVVVDSPLPPPLIHLVKKPNLFILPIGGGAVTYSYAVTNPGTAPLNDVVITDDKCTGLPGRVVDHPGDLNKNNLLESNETWQFTCLTYITQTTTNIGTVTGHANGLTAVDISPVTVVVAAAPGFPNTGVGPEGATWIVVILGGILVAASSFYLGRRNAVA